MERNVCGLDRTVRLALGTAIALVTYLASRNRGERGRPGTLAWWQVAAGYVAADLLLTGLLQWCPMNHLLGVDTCRGDWRTELRSVRRRAPPV